MPSHLAGELAASCWFQSWDHLGPWKAPKCPRCQACPQQATRLQEPRASCTTEAMEGVSTCGSRGTTPSQSHTGVWAPGPSARMETNTFFQFTSPPKHWAHSSGYQDRVLGAPILALPADPWLLILTLREWTAHAQLTGREAKAQRHNHVTASTRTGSTVHGGQCMTRFHAPQGIKGRWVVAHRATPPGPPSTQRPWALHCG